MSTESRIPLRSEIPVEHTWDLSVVFPDDQVWALAVDELTQLLPRIAALEGRVGQSPTRLLETLQLRDEARRRLETIYSYASMRRDSDTSDPAGQALVEKAGSLVARVQASLAFIEPEILAVPDDTLKAWISQEAGLEVYAYDLEELARMRPHIRSSEVEGVMAQYIDVARSTGEIFTALADADLSFPTIQDEKGQEIQISHGRYRRFIESPDPRVRREVFLGYHQAYHAFRNTLGTTLAAEVRSHVVNARLRRHASALDAALKPNHIPVEVYHNLISTIDANLPRLHRYLRLRKRLMGLDELHMYDLYAPLIPGFDLLIPYAEAQAMIQEGMVPLGEEYQAILRQAFRSRWIDVFESAGKRSGAYSGGGYVTPPFILLNYQDRLKDMFTLAHELGHSGHSFLTRRAQPFVYGEYTSFLAEVASTVNEALLTAHLLKTREDRALRRHLIVEQLEDIRTTILRQTMFATFELEIHTAAEAGEALTAEWLSQHYHQLVSRYYGAEVVVDDQIAIEWARIPHFYYNFYVYQYATGLSAALAMSERLLKEGPTAIERYLRFLSRGRSRPSIELLQEAGVDMTTPEPIQQAMDTFDRLLDQLEAVS